MTMKMNAHCQMNRNHPYNKSGKSRIRNPNLRNGNPNKREQLEHEHERDFGRGSNGINGVAIGRRINVIEQRNSRIQFCNIDIGSIVDHWEIRTLCNSYRNFAHL
eukprot:870295_1